MLEKLILTDMVGAFLSVLIPFIIAGSIIAGFIYMEVSLSFAARLVIVWAISTYISAIQSYKFLRWWFKKKDKTL